MTHLNLTHIRENVADDEEFIKEILHLFLTELGSDMNVLEREIQDQNWDRIVGSAHKLKSSFRNLGMTLPWHCLQKIEDIANEQSSIDEISSKFERLKSAIPEVESELRDYLML